MKQKKFIINNLLFLTIFCASIDTLCVLSSDDTWEQLLESNNKFVDNKHFSKERIKLVKSQNPCCIILSCSDSRVPPEIIFQQGLGKVFTVRVAGEVADNVVVDTIEYAINHFDSTIIVVMGHAECGAVIGALKQLKENNGNIPTEVETDHINAVLIPIEKAIIAANIDIYAPDAVSLSVKANVRYVAEQLMQKSPVITESINSGKIKLIGAEYSLATGKVTKLFSHGK